MILLLSVLALPLSIAKSLVMSAIQVPALVTVGMYEMIERMIY